MRYFRRNPEEYGDFYNEYPSRWLKSFAFGHDPDDGNYIRLTFKDGSQVDCFGNMYTVVNGYSETVMKGDDDSFKSFILRLLRKLK